jgi:hypothetical protein
MLMMKRRQGEAILIGDDIEIHLAHIGRTRVKIGIKPGSRGMGRPAGSFFPRRAGAIVRRSRIRFPVR